jgi:biopolymer transport protein ExbD
MSIRFQCPSCGVIHSINEQAIGRRIRCRDCHELMEVVPYYEPQAGELEELTDRDEAADEEASSYSYIDESDAIVLPAEAFAAVEPAPPPIVATPRGDRADGPEAARSSASEPPSAASRPRKPVIFRPDRSWKEGEMDMTPMVDVVFQLLIFFMLTASFTLQKSLNVPKPQSNQASTAGRSIEDFQQNPDNVVVRVDALNTYHVSAGMWDDEMEAPSEQELMVKLRQARRGDGRGGVPTKMLVVANGEALHERVVTAIDAGNDVGMDEVQLVTVEQDE